MNGLVFESAENTDALHHHDPGFRNADVNAAEECVDVDHRAVARYGRVPQVDVNAAEYRHDLAAFEILRVDAAFEAAEDGPHAQAWIRRTCRHAIQILLAVDGPEQHADAEPDQKQRPDHGPHVELEDQEVQIVEQKECANQSDHAAPNLTGRCDALHNPDDPVGDQR